jgi:heme-degrading monooxygenase HmoA
MQNEATSTSNGRNGWVYRVDKFTVPPAARDEFLDRVRRIHRLLETLPGFQDGAVLEQIDSREHLKVVTLAIWENREAFDAARRLVQARYQEEGFDPRELIARLGIEADLGAYHPLGGA